MIPASQSVRPASANGLHSFIDKVSADVEENDAAPRESGASSAISNAIKSKIAHAAANAKKAAPKSTSPAAGTSQQVVAQPVPTPSQ